MQKFNEYSISLILSYQVREKTALLRCTANQAGTVHKLHFQPKNPARAKLAAINNKNGCGKAEVWCIQFVSISYHWYYHIRSGKIQLFSVVYFRMLLLIAANLALARFLGWKWTLWTLLVWLVVQRSKAVFFLTLYGNINDMKHFRTVSITPKPCHSHFCCWWLPIWPKLDFWAEHGAYGLFRIGWCYNRAKLSFNDLIW